MSHATVRFRFLFQNNVSIIKHRDSVFVIPGIIKVSVIVVTASAMGSAEVASAGADFCLKY